MDPLVQVSDIEVRLGRAFATADAARAAALIADLSGEVYALAGDADGDTVFHDEQGALDVPPVIVGVLCDAVIRRFENPRGLTGETLGDYNWQANNGGRGSSLWLTAAERRTIRRAAGLPPVASMQMTSDLPLAPAVVNITTLEF